MSRPPRRASNAGGKPTSRQRVSPRRRASKISTRIHPRSPGLLANSVVPVLLQTRRSTMSWWRPRSAFPLPASEGNSPATLEAEADPSLTRTEVKEGASPPPPSAHDAEGGVNPSSAEVQPSVREDQDLNQGEEIPPVLEERVDASTASPTHVALEPRAHPEIASPPAANRRVPRSPVHVLRASEAELVERRRVVEAALSSFSLLPDQRAILDAALSQFRSTETGIMEVFLGLAKGFEVSTAHASASSLELEGVKHRLAQAKEESLRLRQEAEKAQAVDQRVAELQVELEKAQVEAEQLMISVQKSADLLTKEQKTREATQARVLVVEGDLSASVTERDTLKTTQEKDAAEIRQLDTESREVASRANAAEEDLRQATEVASGAFSDLPRSIEEACQHYGANPDSSDEQQKAF